MADHGAPRARVHGVIAAADTRLPGEPSSSLLRSRRPGTLHFIVTRHPTSEWVVQQLREGFPQAAPYGYAILDRDSKFDEEVITFLKATGLKPKRTSVEAPWQNGIAERGVGSCWREILGHWQRGKS